MKTKYQITWKSQKGAVLFTGMMMLTITALIGVSGTQNTIMQERMAGNYRMYNQSFNRAEETLVDTQEQIFEAVQVSNFYETSASTCGEDFVQEDWVDAHDAGASSWTKDITNCIPGGSMDSDSIVRVYEVVAKNTDEDDSTRARTMLSAVYIP